MNGLASAPDGRIFLTRGFLNRKARGEVTAEELASGRSHTRWVMLHKATCGGG